MRRSDMTPGRLVLGATMALVALCAAPARAQFSIDAPVNYSTGARPDGVAPGDFDGDGDTDLAIVTNPQGQGNNEFLEIYLNNGDGTFTAGQALRLPNSSSPGEAKAADFDGDGDDDVVVVLKDFQQVILVVNTNGTFSLGATAPVGDRAIGMSAADYDGDGDMDLAVANRRDDTATVLTNRGNGTFSSQTVAVGSDPRAAAFVDINGGPTLDLAVANHNAATISLFTSTGNVFAAAGTISTPAPLRPNGLVGADLDGDGDGELAVASDGNGIDRVLVYLNRNGAYGTPVQYATNGANPSGILAADLDCDGALDLATTNQMASSMSLLHNLGGATFGAPQVIGLPSESSQFAAVNLDGDSDGDLVVTNVSANSFSVLINQTCTGGGRATLTDLTMIDGFIVAGGLPEMASSDDMYFSTLALETGKASETHRLLYQVGATTAVQNPSMMDITLEGHILDIEATVTLLLQNVNTGLFEQVGQFTNVFGTDTTHTVNVPNASRFADANGGIVLHVKKVIILPLTVGEGFPSRDDLLEITVN